MDFKNHTNCRVCGNDKLQPYLCLGDMPLSNNLATTAHDKVHSELYQLKLLFCDQCLLSQLSIVVSPEKMFSNYVYRSSISQGFLNHCNRMAHYLTEKYKLSDRTVHIDIAGNDGALLGEFRSLLDHTILNVDPAVNLNAVCNAARIPIFTEFWSMLTAQKILNGGLLNRAASKSRGDTEPLVPGADLVTATNVFAHVDDVTEFLQAVKLVMKKTGVLVLEFPYLIDFIEKNEFDTVYFEHLSYFSIYPLTLLCQKVGLNVMSVSHHEIHGGSVRVEIGYGPQDETVDKFVRLEKSEFGTLERYLQFNEEVGRSINDFRLRIGTLPGQVAGFAASAKGNTLLNCAKVNPGIMRYIVDETPEKIGRWSPGVRIPIVSLHDMMRTPPDYLVVLSWNFAEEIMRKCRAAGYKGKFVIPIPQFRVVS